MAMKLNLSVTLSLGLNPFPKFNSKKLHAYGCRRGLHVSRSSLVEEQQQSISFSKPETHLIDALIGIQGRGKSASPQQLQEVESAVKALEGLEGVPEPTSSDLIEGCWQLMFTTRPGTASPIQRTFVGVDFFSVFQEVYLKTNDPRVSNIVRFSDAIGELKVEAAAAIENGKRIIFRFDRAAFSFNFLPFKVPYPVPFRLLGDEAKGWLDTTYLSPSGNLRISRGNKVNIVSTVSSTLIEPSVAFSISFAGEFCIECIGSEVSCCFNLLKIHSNISIVQGTTFVLQKKTEPRQRLLAAISTETQVREAIDEFVSLNKNTAKDEIELLDGEWQMIWSSQTETDSWIENAANGLMGKQIVKNNGQLKFVVDILLGLRFSMTGTFEKSGTNKYNVIMDDAAIIAGPYGYPLEMETKINLELLYTDEKIRISKGYNGIIFVHVRTDGTKQE